MYRKTRYVLTCLLVTAFAAPALADRAGAWEATVQLVGNANESSQGRNGSSLEVDNDVGLAFGAAYNFNEHLAAGLELTFLNPDYTATIQTDNNGSRTYDTELDVFNGQLSATWNFLPGAFTPYAQAGIGWTYIDSNIIDGLPVTGCWWDPWWGYVCTNYYSTYDDTRFSYGAGLGLRYEFSRTMFASGGYSHVEIDGGGDGVEPELDLWRLQLGWIIPAY